MYKYWKKFIDRKGTYVILRTYLNDTGNKRVSETSPKYVKWLNDGNTVTEIPFVVPTLAKYKTYWINQMSSLAFSRRAELLPDYKLTNANMRHPTTGAKIYSDSLIIKYFDFIVTFRTEFYRLKTAINSATTLDEVDTAVNTENYPTVLS